jgi:hypothetical protein
MGVPFELKHATEGMAEGNPAELQRVHSPGPEGTQEAQKAHAHATTSEVDPPVKISTGRVHKVGLVCLCACVCVGSVCGPAPNRHHPPSLLCRRKKPHCP